MAYRTPHGDSLPDHKVVGFLIEHHAEPLNVTYKHRLGINENILVGRASDVAIPLRDDPTISNHHLQLWSIPFDTCNTAAKNGEPIEPLVYVQVLSSNITRLMRQQDFADPGKSSKWMELQRGDRAVLLNHRDCLVVSSEVSYTWQKANADLVQVKSDHAWEEKAREKAIFARDYTISRRRVGIGAWAQVHLAYETRSGDQLACKIVNLTVRTKGISQKMNQGDTDEQQRTSRLIREVRVLENLSHPNIISLERAYITPRTMYLGNILRMVVSFADTHPSYIFQELVTSGDLFSYLEFRGGRLDDLATAVIVRQILQAVRYLHQHGIVHRDLKPENILMTSFRDGARVVVTDFGLSRFLPGFDVVRCSKLQRMESQLGTPSYAAPEMMDKINKGWPDEGYTKAVDLWSVGVITQCLLSGSLPFEGLEERQAENERTKMWQKAIKCNSRGLDDRLSTGETIGERPKDFIRGLIILDGHQRMSADAALAHSWFTNRYHKKEFEALYKRAIEKWTSRHKPGHMLENLRVPSVLGKTKRLEPVVSQAMHCHKQSISEPVLTKLLSSSTSELIDTEPRISSSQASLRTKHKACQCITATADVLHLQDKPSPVGRSNTTVEETGLADYDVSSNRAETELLCGTQFSEHSYNGGLAADLVAPTITGTATCIADSPWLNT